jgi:type IV pilus assembly protein PilV
MQSYAMKLNKGADFRSQAVMLASDLAERIEANKAGAISGAYQYTCPAIPAAISTACGPSGAACIASSLATYDLLEWRAQVASTLPQSACSVNLTTAGNPSIYSISITWVDRQSDVAYDASIVSQSGAGELLTYQTTRTVFN